MALFILIIILGVLLLILIIIAILAILWKRDAKRAQEAAEQANKSAQAAQEAVQLAQQQILQQQQQILQQQQLNQAGLQPDAVPPLTPPPADPADGDGTRPWVNPQHQGDYVASTWAEYYGTQRTVGTAGIQLQPTTGPGR